MKVFDVHSEFKDYENVHLVSYNKDNSLIIGLSSSDNIPITLLTIDIDYSTNLGNDMAFIDTDSAAWAEAFLKENKIARPVNIKVRSKGRVYPLYKFDLDVLKEFIN